jgi:hypothetical protein
VWAYESNPSDRASSRDSDVGDVVRWHIPVSEYEAVHLVSEGRGCRRFSRNNPQHEVGHLVSEEAPKPPSQHRPPAPFGAGGNRTGLIRSGSQRR